MKNGIIKAITIGVFLTLILGFVVFKSGYFEKDGILSNIDFTGVLSDSTKKDSLSRAPMMSSSKSLTITDKSLFDGDTTLKTSDSISKKAVDSMLKGDHRLYSSKSAIIFKPSDLKFNFDSLHIDTAKKK